MSADLVERLTSALESAWRSACDAIPGLSDKVMTMWPDVDADGTVRVSVGKEGHYGRTSATTPEQLGEQLAADLKERFGDGETNR